MRSANTFCLVSTLLALSAGCLDTATNESEILPPINQDDSPSNGDSSGGDGDSSGGDGDTGGGDGDSSGGDGDSSGGDGDTGGGDGDTGGGDGDTGGGDGDAASMISGSAEAAGCQSFTAQTDSTCYGFYCGISKETLASAVLSSRKCDYPVEDACAGLLSTKVGSCARTVKSQNIFASEADIRTKTGECVYEDAKLKSTVSMGCLDCYLDAAMCASKHCVTQCLSGDSKNCDECRLKNNCNQPVPGCAGLPSPF